MCWVDSRAMPALGRDPAAGGIPVGGLYRNEMLHHLEVAGWRPSTSTTPAQAWQVCAAVAAGVGISLLPVRVISAEHKVLDAHSGLPDIQGVFLALCGRMASATRAIC